MKLLDFFLDHWFATLISLIIGIVPPILFGMAYSAYGKSSTEDEDETEIEIKIKITKDD